MFYGLLFLLCLGTCCLMAVSWGQASQAPSRILALPLLITLILFAGLRGVGVDRDYMNYVAWVNDLEVNITWLDYIKDPAFVLLARTTQIFHLPIAMMFLAFAVVSVQAKYKVAVKFDRYSALLFFAFFCRFYAVHDLTQIRAAVCIPLGTLAVILAVEKQWMHAIGALLAGLLFHISAVAFAPIVLLLYFYRGIPGKVWFLLPVLGGFALLAARQPLTDLVGSLQIDRLNPYTGGSYIVTPISLLSFGFLTRLCIFALVVFFARNRLSRLESVSLFCCGLGLSIQVAFSWNDVVALRGAELFGLFDLIVFFIPLRVLPKVAGYIYMLLILFILSAFYFSSLKLLGPYWPGYKY